MNLTEIARAKVNLCLHVLGRDDTGYHRLDSLVVFPDFGDNLSFTPGGPLRLTVTGPFSNAVPVTDDNLILRAARLMGQEQGHFQLRKNLPVASGIGGGSADAAAAVRLLTRTGLAAPDTEALASLGMDVPVCVEGRSARMTGYGERVDPLPPLPAFSLLLVNPGLAVSTPSVFGAMRSRSNPPLPPIPEGIDFAEFATYLRAQRNDLEGPAVSLAPVITEVLTAIRQFQTCGLSRMSGSGATCFGLFETRVAADQAAEYVASTRPDWWVAVGDVG